MIQDKTIFIVPGYKQKPANKAYKQIAAMLKKKGYKSVLVNIPWKQTTISENTEHFLRRYKKINSKKKYILGFSFGAMIAFLASTKVEVCGLMLCSLSPYFKEDLSEINNRRFTSLAIKQYQDFSTLHCAKLAKQIKAKQILMLYGTKEAISLRKRVNYTFMKISSKHKHLIPISKTEHNIGDKRYLNTINKVTRMLN